MTGRQFLLFTVIGGIGFSVDGGLMMAISEHTALNPMQARPFSFAVAVTVTWWLNRTLTFSRTSRGRVDEWARYVGVNTFGAVVNLGVFYFIMLAFPTLRAYPLTVLAIAAAIALLANFAGSKRLVFGEPAPARPEQDPISTRGTHNG